MDALTSACSRITRFPPNSRKVLPLNIATVAPRDDDSKLDLTLVCPVEWTDYNGHMNVAYYARAFDIASTAYLSSQASDVRTPSLFRSRIDYRREVLEGSALRFRVRLLPSASDSPLQVVIFMTAMPESDGESYLAAVEMREFRNSRSIRENG